MRLGKKETGELLTTTSSSWLAASKQKNADLIKYIHLFSARQSQTKDYSGAKGRREV